jgi:hypothetical protein
MYNPTLHLPPLGHSDHQCLLLVPKQKEKLPAYSRQVSDQSSSITFLLLSRKVVLEDWSDVYAAEEIDEKVKVFTSTICSQLWMKLSQKQRSECTPRINPG